eukprot:scaffold56030_cov17-Prasinocladus_malaysianus.AAC.1
MPFFPHDFEPNCKLIRVHSSGAEAVAGQPGGGAQPQPTGAGGGAVPDTPRGCRPAAGHGGKDEA